MKFFLILILVALASCGPKTKTIKKKKVYGGKSIGIPVALMISQKECLPDAPDSEFHQVSLINLGDLSLFHVNYNARSYGVKSMEFAGEFHASTQLSLLNKPKVIRKATNFKTCKTTRKFEENSYQDATLSILAPIKRLEANYPGLFRYLNLEPVKIRTAPLLKQGNQYLINNAFYYSGTNEITFLPQGYVDEQDRDLPFNGKPFWKFPMVSLHEYGHHIFSQLYKRSARTNRNQPAIELPPLTAGEFLCFDNSHIHSTDSITKDDSKRSVNKVMALTAVNEAFADIFAYYAEPFSRGLEGMGCLQRSRDIEYSSFFNGERKVLSSTAMDLFLSSEKMDYTSCAVQTNYQDPHIIGAIIARAIYESLAAKGLTDRDKLQIIVEWIEQFTQKSFDINDPAELLKLAVKSFESTLKRNVTVGQIECINYYSRFSGLMENSCF